MPGIQSGTESPNIRTFSGDPTQAPGIPGIPNQLLIRTDNNTLYSYRGPLDTNWVLLGSSGGGIPPSLGSEVLEDFINAAGVNFVIDVAPGTGIITSSPNTRTVGLAQLSPGANNSGVSVQTTQGFTKQINDVDLGVLTLEWIASLNNFPAVVPAVGSDYTARMLAGTTIQSGFGNGLCLGFTLGLAENGNANWWAVLSDAVKFDTGVLVTTGFHKYTIVFDPTIPRIQWFIDGVLRHTFNGVPSAIGFAIAIYASIKSITAANNSVILLDYMYWKQEFTRP
jgi:hypothetical protein